MNARMLSRAWRAWCAALAAGVVVTIAACGGGGGGGGATPGPGGPPAGAAGLVVYSYLTDQLGVDMSTGRTSTLVKGDVNLYFAGIGIGPGREVALAYNSSLIGPNSTLTVRLPDGSLVFERKFGHTIENAPKFSADGSKIAYVGRGSSGARLYFVEVLDRSGNRVDYFEDFDQFDWLPDARLVVRDPATRELYASSKVDPNFVDFIPNTERTSWFSISPDGSKLAASRSGVPNAPRRIYMMNLDGSGLRQVTTSDREETRVVFSPSGQQLLVTSYGCSSTTGGSVDEDLLHVISATATAPIEIATNVNSAPTRLADEQGRGRCSSFTLLWR
jgi:WD40-like Beta Propeller Repeat